MFVLSDISRNQELILKKLNELSEPSTKQLYENEVISEIYKNQRTLSTVLKRLEEEDGLVESGEDGRNKTWSLTSKGQSRLRKVFEREQNSIQEDERMKDEFDYQKAVNEFEAYFRGPGKDKIIQDVVERNQAAVYLNHQEVAEKIHPDIADHLLTNPKEVLNACKDTLRRLSFIDRDIDVRVNNVSDFETKTISQLSAQDIGNLAVVEGILRSVSPPQVEEMEATFECINCGQRMRSTNQKKGEVKKPYKCDCGCESFDKIRATQKTVRYLNIQEKPSRGNRQKMTAKVVGNLAEDESQNLKATGSGIKIIGYLESFRKNKRDESLRLRLRANNIEIEEDKWEDIDISSDELKRIEEVAGRDDTRDFLMKSFASGRVRHMDLLKETHLLWFLGRSEADGNLHCLAVGEPGLGKSELGKYVHDEYPRVLKAVGTGTSAVGLTASVTKDEVTGDWVAEAGKLAMADGAFFITDEIDKVSGEDMEKMNEALSERTITLDKANIHTELSADVSVFALGNPTGKFFDDTKKAYKQIPIDNEDFQDRFDVILALKRRDINEEENEQKEREIAKLILSRGQDLDVDFSSVEYSDDELFSKDMMIKYLYHAQRLEPVLTEEAMERLHNLYIDFKQMESEGEKLWDLRRLASLKKLSMAYARLHLSEEVKLEHVEMASDFMKRCFDTLDFQLGKDDFGKFRQSVSKSKPDKVLEKIKEITSEKGEDIAYVDEVAERLEMSEDEIRDYANRLENEKELMNPKPQGYRPLR